MRGNHLGRDGAGRGLVVRSRYFNRPHSFEQRAICKKNDGPRTCFQISGLLEVFGCTRSCPICLCHTQHFQKTKSQHPAVRITHSQHNTRQHNTPSAALAAASVLIFQLTVSSDQHNTVSTIHSQHNNTRQHNTHSTALASQLLDR